MWLTYAAGRPRIKAFHSRRRQSEGGTDGEGERERGRARMGAKEEKFKACEVKLEGRTLSASSLPA